MMHGRYVEKEVGGIPRSRLMGEVCFLVFLSLCTLFPLQDAATATSYSLQPGQIISGNQTLVSVGGIFALGFFDLLDASSGASKTYLGIWYYKIPKRTVVWVANRDRPLANSSAFVNMTDDGNLVLMDSNNSSIWSSDVPSITINAVARLLDSGNLVLTKGYGANYWESFDHPTDTFLPGMTLRYNGKAIGGQRLVAWRSLTDPSSGNFSFGLSSLQIVIWTKEEILCSSGALVGSSGFIYLPGGEIRSLPFEFDVSHAGRNTSIVGRSVAGSTPVRWSLNPEGLLQLTMWNEKWSNWTTTHAMPLLACDTYRACGTWGACDINAEKPACRCLKGFVAKNQTRGCVRQAPLLFSAEDNFVPVENTKLPDGFDLIQTRDEADCKSACVSSNQCTAYSYTNTTMEPDGFVCLVWKKDLEDLRAPNNGGSNLYIRMAAPEAAPVEKPRRRNFLLPLVVSLSALVVGVAFLFLACRLKARRQRRAREINMLAEVDVPNAFGRVPELSDAPFMDFKAIKRSTNNFSDKNKLGHGGFGPVYKGQLENGQEVAVKKLSTGSTQGLSEFANEVKLIAKLQHKNLVRLLGWSSNKDEKILVYELLPNKSLDKIIFKKEAELSWEKRFAIIGGIADGLLYLHQHSRMRVIHRDLKTANILLDKEMNPKISDFGLAKIVVTNQTHGETKKRAGTLGYMSPEYFNEGVFSEKSDVFAFGVIMLEIISGTECIRNYPSTGSPNLLTHAWRLWSKGRAEELFDPQVAISLHVDKALKFTQVALLCVQENAAERPTMDHVVSRLAAEGCRLQPPGKPGLSPDTELGPPAVEFVNELNADIFDCEEHPLHSERSYL